MGNCPPHNVKLFYLYFYYKTLILLFCLFASHYRNDRHEQEKHWVKKFRNDLKSGNFTTQLIDR